MKCNYKRSYGETLNKKWEQQKKEYDEWLNDLSNLKDTFNLLSIYHALDINKYY